MLDLNTSPFKVIRRKTGMTQGEFADFCKQSRSTMVYVEAGLYEHNPDIPRTALLQLAADRDVDVREVVESYRGHDLDEATVWFQQQYRKRAAGKVKDAFNAVLGDSDPEALRVHEVSPFERFAIHGYGSVDGFAKQLKFPPVVGRQFRLGDTRTIPRVIRTALVDAGLTHGQVSKIEEAQIEWFDRELEMVSVVD